MARPRGGYANAAGERIPGVTTVVGMLDKPALVGWAGKESIEGATKHYLAIINEMKDKLESATTWNQVQDVIEMPVPPCPTWRDICYGKRDQAAEDGTTAHDLFERYLNGEDVSRGEHSEAAWRAFENAREWHRGLGHDVHVWPHERSLISKLDFAGTPDAISKSPEGKVELADWKTGQGVYESQMLQLSAYAHLLEEVEGMRVDGCHLVRFHRDHGDFHHHHYDRDVLDAGWEIFRRLVELWPMLAAFRKRLK